MLIVLIAALAGTLPLLASTLIAGTAVDYIGRRRVSMIADGLSGLSVVAVPVILALCAVVGLVYGPIAPIYNYVIQTRAPQHLCGRVVGVMGSLAYAAGPLGLILAGPLADTAGLQTTFLALSLPMLAIGVIAFALPSLRELDRAPDSRDRATAASAITDLAAQLTEGSVATDPDIMASSRQRGAADPDACLHGQAQFPGRLGL